MLDYTLKLSDDKNFIFYFRFTAEDKCEVIDEEANVYQFERNNLVYEKVTQFENEEEQIAVIYFDTMEK